MNTRVTRVCKCGKSFGTYSETGFALCPICRKINDKKFTNIALFDENHFSLDETYSLSDFDLLKDKFTVNVKKRGIDKIIRKSVIQIRVSEQERSDLHSYASLMNIDLSTLIRSVLLTQYFDILKKK